MNKIKKLGLMVLSSVLLLATPVFAEEKIDLYIGKDRVDGYVYKNGDRTMVPFRTVLESFGAEVTYDAKTKEIHTKYLDYKQSGKETIMKIGSKVIYGKAFYPLNPSKDSTYDPVTLDTAPEVKNGKVYIPSTSIRWAIPGVIAGFQRYDDGPAHLTFINEKTERKEYPMKKCATMEEFNAEMRAVLKSMGLEKIDPEHQLEKYFAIDYKDFKANGYNMLTDQVNTSNFAFLGNIEVVVFNINPGEFFISARNIVK